MKVFCNTLGADEVILFERQTFLVISHHDARKHEDKHRFEKISNIINESNYKSEDGILILRTFLQKAKRLLNLYEKQNEGTSLDGLVENYKPPIFWKDKPIIKKQLENWSIPKIKDLIININKTEEFLKKNSSVGLMLVFNFIYETSERS